MFTRKERKLAKFILKYVPEAKWVQRSYLGKLYLLDKNQDIIIEINKNLFKNVGNCQTWKLKFIKKEK